MDLTNLSFVLLAQNHNPTVVVEDFWKSVGVIKDASEIKKENLIITPGLSQLHLESGERIVVDPNRFQVVSNSKEKLIHILNSYCKNLRYIQGQALGFNFNIVRKPNIYKEYLTKILWDAASDLINLAFQKTYNSSIATINVDISSEDQAVFSFNFNYNFVNTALGDLKIDFQSEWEICENNAKDFVSNLEQGNLSKV